MATRILRTAIVAIVVATMASAAWAQQGSPRIVPRDQLAITVLGIPALSGKFPVDQEGMVTYPYLGRLKAAGLTAAEFEVELKKRLEPDWVLNAQVRVEFEPTASKKVSVTGAVKAAGEFMFAGELRVFDALVKAGMPTPDAGDEVLVVRLSASGGEEAKTEVIRVSLRELEKGNLEQNVLLEDGDHVRVTKGELVTISGQVKSPGAYAVMPGMTVRQALALAGDVTEKGTHRGMRILRKVPGKDKPEEIKNVKLEDLVKPGDTIIVARRIM